MRKSLLPALLTGALAALPAPIHAGEDQPSYWHRLRSGIERVTEALSGDATGEVGAAAVDAQLMAAATATTMPAEPFPERSDYPPNWHFERLRDPVFGGEILVVEAGKTNPQTLILVHGLGQNGFRDWSLQIDALAAHFHVVALDLPGFGYSDVTAGRYSPTEYARVLAWLSARYGRGKVHVAGHSMGATVALRFAANYPQQVERLVLIDATGILERTAFLKHSAEIPVQLPEVPGLLRKFIAQLKDLSDSVVELSGYAPDPTGLLLKSDQAWNLMFSDAPSANAAVALIEEEFTEAVYTLPHATTIIWGEQDPVAPLRTGQALADRLPAAHLVTIADAAHVPMRSHPDALNRLMLDALLKPLPARQGQPVPPDSQGDLTCRNQTGTVYRGRYRHIELDHCTAVRFEQVEAASISLNESIATFHQVQVEAQGVAIRARESVLRITAGSITGATAISADASRLDLVAVTLTGHETAVRSREGSRVIVSISDMRSPLFTGYVHGAFKVADATLDQVLADRSDR